MDKKEIKAIIEALLFTWGDPLEISDISSVLDLSKKEAKEIIDEMKDEFNYNMRGLQIIKINDSYQIGTRSEHYKWIKKLKRPKKERSLSNAALETLSIIAYKQPVIKSEIETIRGVKCDTAIYTLLDKEMIEERGRLDRVGKPIIYGTTDKFLKTFGLENLDRLPPLIDELEIEDKIKEDVFKEEVSEEG